MEGIHDLPEAALETRPDDALAVRVVDLVEHLDDLGSHEVVGSAREGVHGNRMVQVPDPDHVQPAPLRQDQLAQQPIDLRAMRVDHRDPHALTDALADDGGGEGRLAGS